MIKSKRILLIVLFLIMFMPQKAHAVTNGLVALKYNGIIFCVDKKDYDNHIQSYKNYMVINESNQYTNELAALKNNEVIFCITKQEYISNKSIYSGYKLLNYPKNLKAFMNFYEAEDKGFIEMGKEQVLKIIDSIKNLPENIVKFTTKQIKEYSKFKIEKISGVINSSLDLFQSWLKEEDLNSSRFSLVKKLWQGLLPIGYSMISLFLVIQFSNKALYFQLTDNRQILKLFLKLILGNMFVRESYNLLQILVSINRKIVNICLGVANAENMRYFKRLVLDINRANTMVQLDEVSQGIENMSVVMFLIIIVILVAICFVVLIIRNLKLGVLTVFAPLYFATFVADSTGDVLKKYIKNYISILLQTVYMAISLAFLSSGYIESMAKEGLFTGTPIRLMIGIFTFVVFIIKAPASIESTLGGSSSKVNILSLLKGRRY